LTNNSLAIVLAGHGTSTDKNIESLLELNIPEGDISPFTVQRVTRAQKGLKTALAWFEGEDLEVERVTDPIAKLVEYKAKKGWDAHLVMVPDPINEDDIDLITQAHEAGITVKDLTGAYDDILPVEKEEPANENDGPVEPNVKFVASQFTDAEVNVLKKFAAQLLSWVNDSPSTVTYREGGASSPVQTLSGDDAPFDGGTQVGSATKQPGTTVMFMNEDGHYRNAEGHRKTSKEIRVWLTDEEIESLPLAIYDPES
jgi:hypothetical protein